MGSGSPARNGIRWPNGSLGRRIGDGRGQTGGQGQFAGRDAVPLDTVPDGGHHQKVGAGQDGNQTQNADRVVPHGRVQRIGQRPGQDSDAGSQQPVGQPVLGQSPQRLVAQRHGLFQRFRAAPTVHNQRPPVR